MPLPPIVVEVAPPPDNPALVQTLLSACREAARNVDCIVNADAHESSSAVAIVSWRSETEVHIQVGIRRDDGADWRSRSLHFEDEDRIEERWRTAGFAIGTLSVRLQLPNETRGPEATPREAPPPSGLAGRAPEPVERDGSGVQVAPIERAAAPGDIFLDVAVVAGTGLSEAPRFGASVGLGYVWARPGWYGALGFTYAESRQGGVALRFWEGEAALGLRYSMRRAGFVAEVGPFAQQLSAVVFDADERDSASRLVGGGRVKGYFAYRLFAELDALFGGYAGVSGGRTSILVRGEEQAVVPRYELGLRAGLRFGLNQ